MTPCKNCLVFSQCKTRLYEFSYGVTGMAISEGCKKLARHLYSHKDFTRGVNSTRKVFGLKTIVNAIGRANMKQVLEKEYTIVLRGDSHP